MENKKIKTILVVDDDRVQTRLLDGILSENGFDVTISSEASEGLQIAIDSPPDLIILDVMMPIINGYNFCKLLKDHSEKIHIILVTSRDKQEDVEIGMSMGANAYLTKPIDREKLLKTINIIEKRDHDSLS